MGAERSSEWLEWGRGGGPHLNWQPRRRAWGWAWGPETFRSGGPEELGLPHGFGSGKGEAAEVGFLFLCGLQGCTSLGQGCLRCGALRVALLAGFLPGNFWF